MKQISLTFSLALYVTWLHVNIECGPVTYNLQCSAICPLPNYTIINYLTDLYIASTSQDITIHRTLCSQLQDGVLPLIVVLRRVQVDHRSWIYLLSANLRWSGFLLLYCLEIMAELFSKIVSASTVLEVALFPPDCLNSRVFLLNSGGYRFIKKLNSNDC